MKVITSPSILLSSREAVVIVVTTKFGVYHLIVPFTHQPIALRGRTELPPEV